MDADGWLPISLIMSFPKVQSLTRDPNMIVSACAASEALELVNEKVRKLITIYISLMRQG